MAHEREERPTATAKKGNDSGEDAIPMKRAAGAATAAAVSARPTQLSGVVADSTSTTESSIVAAGSPKRQERYLIGSRASSEGQPFIHATHRMDEVVEYLSRQENVEVVKRVKLGGTRPFSSNADSVDEVVVANIDEGKAQRLRAAAPPHLIVEQDAPLLCADYFSLPARSAPIGTLVPLRPLANEVSIRVVGERDQPLANAAVIIDAGGLPAQAITDDMGLARVTFFGGSVETIQTLFVRAAANYWDRVIHGPRLGQGTTTNTVKLRRLGELYPQFPQEKLLGWGQRLLGLDPLAGRFSGAGVKIGIIDSGCDNTHPLLRHVTRGKDFTAAATEGSWSHDALSHGTHCSGIIGAASSGSGVVGCAPAAELHIFKVLPEGRVSDLLAALDECIQRELDLINISVVIPDTSQLIAQKLMEARRRGIACVVAAGNNALGPPLFPATVPGLMAVAAIGKLREFPQDSSHALSALPQLIGADEVFAASFSSAGPQVSVSAPGVAIISTVPGPTISGSTALGPTASAAAALGGAYAAADGTSAAAAHITGLAALVLAHHPLFQEGPWATRSEHRVHALFELIRSSAVPRFYDLHRNGAGVPDLRRIPVGQSFAIRTLTSDGTEAVAMPPSWPTSSQGWPTWLPLRAAGF